MSNKQFAKFEEAGIKVTFDGKDYLGRQKPVTFEFEGKKINAGEFTNELGTNPKFRSAVRKAYNSKFAGFMDNVWEKITAKFKVSKAATEIAGETDELSLKNVQKATSTENLSEQVRTSNGRDHSTQTREIESNGVLKQDANGNYPAYGEGEAGTNELIEQNNAIMEDIANDADSIAADGGTKAGTEAAEQATEAIAEKSTAIFTKGAMSAAKDTLLSGVKVTGMLDSACTVYRAVQALGYAAKTVRAVQLARFAMLFLNVADQIKAGDANPDDVSYLGKILTTEIATTLASMKYKSATDSFGYKFAAYGEKGQMSTIASQFLAGGGLPGQLISVTNTINNVLGGTPKATCKLLGNTFIGIGSAAVGVAMMFIPGAGPVIVSGKVIAQAALDITFTVGMMLLPELLKDIVAGKLVDKTTVGEAAGDAYVSGASGIMSSLAQRGGNAPLTPAEAVAYNNLSKDIIAQYAEEDRLAYSPFDISNSNTFMGKIFAQLIPYAANMSSLPSILSSLVLLPTRSLAMVTSNNAMAVDEVANYTMCQDLDYNNLTDVSDESGDQKVQLATDPYCNVMYGIPTEALETDPLDVVNALENQIDETTGTGQIDPETGLIIGKDYQTFFTDCIARNRPLGDKGPDFQLSDGHECLFQDNPNEDHYNSNYYLYYIDQRVLSSMDDDLMAIDPTPIPYTYVDPYPPLPDPVNNGSSHTFTEQEIKDLYNTSTAGPDCPAGTSYARMEGNIRLCSIPGTNYFSQQGRSVVVNSRVADAWLALANAFRDELKANYMYSRDGVFEYDQPESDEAISQHNLYLALDIDMENMEKGNSAMPGNRNYDWISSNAGRFGMEKGAEAWHYVPSGN